MKSYAYYNGIISEYKDASVPLSDRSIYFGDAVYDVMIGRCGICYQWNEHVGRLFANAKLLGIRAPKTDTLKQAVSELIEKNNAEEFTVYVQLSRNCETRVHAYPDGCNSNLLITVTESHFPNQLTDIDVIFTEDIRYGMCNVKTVNLLPAVLASKTADEKLCEEAVFLLSDGTVTECSHSNVFIIREKALYTHPKSTRILPGITRDNLLKFCNLKGIPYVEKPFTKQDLLSADEVFVSSTTKFIRRVTKADNCCLKMKNTLLVNELFRVLYDDFLNGTSN